MPVRVPNAVLALPVRLVEGLGRDLGAEPLHPLVVRVDVLNVDDDARMGINAESRRRMDGIRGLTPREAEVVGWVARGKTNAEIGAALYISPQTVRKHLENVFEKLGVRTRTAAAAYARSEITTDLT